MPGNPLIVFDPNPKCFGATSALLHIAKHLSDLEVVVLAGGSAAQLTERSDITTIRCDVKDPAAVASKLDGLRRPFTYVSISNLTNVPAMITRRTPLVHIDILFWMDNTVNAAMTNADAYIIENFPSVNELLTTLEGSIRAPHVVGPLVNDLEMEARRPATIPPVVVNLGGAESPLLQPGRNTNYPVLIAHAVLDWANRSALPTNQMIHIGAGERAVQTIRQRIDLPSWVVLDTYSLDHFNSLVANCSFLMTAPGLNAPFEAFRHSKPVVFLPPQNFTQVFQLKTFQEFGIQKEARIGLEELVDRPAPTLAFGEQYGTALVLECLKDMGTDRAMKRLAEEMDRQVSVVMDPERRTDLLWMQDRFMAELGHDGPKRAADIIKKIACASR